MPVCCACPLPSDIVAEVVLSHSRVLALETVLGHFLHPEEEDFPFSAAAVRT